MELEQLIKAIGQLLADAAPMQSESVANLAAALLLFQAQVTPAIKDAANPFLKSKYADLESCWEAVRAPLSGNGLAISQTTRVLPSGKQVLVTTLMHTSGEWIKGELYLAGASDDPQKQGSAITYARRYALAAITGLVQSDDDAEGAMNRDQKKAATQAPKPQTNGTQKPDAKSAASSNSTGAGTPPDPKTSTSNGATSSSQGTAAEPAQQASGAAAATEQPVTGEEMKQLLAAGEANGWTKPQISKWVCFAFKLQPATFSKDIKYSQWETAVKVVGRPENQGGKVMVTGSGKALPLKDRWQG